MHNTDDVPSKEYYLEEINNAADKIKEKAEYILEDFYSDKIMKLDISINISPLEVTTITLNKEYGVY